MEIAPFGLPPAALAVVVAPPPEPPLPQADNASASASGAAVNATNRGVRMNHPPDARPGQIPQCERTLTWRSPCATSQSRHDVGYLLRLVQIESRWHTYNCEKAIPSSMSCSLTV